MTKLAISPSSTLQTAGPLSKKSTTLLTPTTPRFLQMVNMSRFQQSSKVFQGCPKFMYAAWTPLTRKASSWVSNPLRFPAGESSMPIPKLSTSQRRMSIPTNQAGKAPRRGASNSPMENSERPRRFSMGHSTAASVPMENSLFRALGFSVQM